MRYRFANRALSVNLVLFVGCSRRKLISSVPEPALELYRGGGVPEIRDCVDRYPLLRERVFILSAKYGLLSANERIASYDLILTLEMALAMRRTVWADVQRRVLQRFEPEVVMVLAEPLYFTLVSGLLEHEPAARVIWEPDIRRGKHRILGLLEAWGSELAERNQRRP